MSQIMWEWFQWIVAVAVMCALCWYIMRLVRQTQDGDRRYGNPDNWDPPSGDHS